MKRASGGQHESSEGGASCHEGHACSCSLPTAESVSRSERVISAEEVSSLDWTVVRCRLSGGEKEPKLFWSCHEYVNSVQNGSAFEWPGVSFDAEHVAALARIYRVSLGFRKLCVALARVLAMLTAFANVTGRQFMVAPGYSHE